MSESLGSFGAKTTPDAAGNRVSEVDVAAVSRQLGRPARNILAVVARCACGEPTVVMTAPRLLDGTPFPTLFYLTHPLATAAASELESRGVMRDMQAQLAEDPDLAAQYRKAHKDYLQRREQLGEVPEIAGISAGGMPDRVKCLHVLVAHALALGPGVNPLGDRALTLMAPRWSPATCTCQAAHRDPATEPEK